MPNWCENHLTVTGATPGFRAWLTDHGFSFEKMNPVSSDAKPPTRPWTMKDACHEAWGTKWDLDENLRREVASQLIETGAAYFDTAWSPPLAANAERAEQERFSGTTGKKSVAKKVAKKNVPSAKPSDDRQIELFPTSPINVPTAPADPLLERIAAFRYELPDAPRPPDANSLGYYRILIPALIQEAGGNLSWDVLHTAAALLADKDLLLTILDEKNVKSAKSWARKSKLPTDPDVFATGVEEAILTSRKVKLTGTAPAFELRLSPDVLISRAPWHLLDARLALTAAVAAIEQGASVQISEKLNEKITQFARSA